MNLRTLIKFLVSKENELQEKKSDYLINFNRIKDKSELKEFAEYVVESIPDNTIKSIHKRAEELQLKIEYGDITVFCNGEKVSEGSLHYKPFKTASSSSSKKQPKSYIFTFDVNLTDTSQYIKILSEYYDFIIKHYNIERIIFEIKNYKDINLIFKNYGQAYDRFPYFYEYNDVFYCTYLKIYRPDDYEQDPFMFYMIDGARDKKTAYEIDKSYIKHRRAYIEGNDSDYSIFSRFMLGVFKEAIKEDDKKMFIKNYFLSSEKNNFYFCFKIFKQEEEFGSIFTTYLSQLDDQRKILLLNMLFYTCFCEEKCYCKSDTFAPSIPVFYSRKGCDVFNEIFTPSDEDKLEFENLRIQLLQEFFTYCLENHEQIILKYKNSFINMMLEKIYYGIKNYFRKIYEDVIHLICLIKKEEFLVFKEEYKKKFEEVAYSYEKNYYSSKLNNIENVLKIIEDIAEEYNKKIIYGEKHL